MASARKGPVDMLDTLAGAPAQRGVDFFVIDDPTSETGPILSETERAVRTEQAVHAITLNLMNEFLNAIRVRGAGGGWATRFCVLCQYQGPGARARCLHVQGREHVNRERQRMEQGERR